MKLVTFRHDGRTSIGKIVEDTIVDLPRADAQLPSTMLELLQGGAEAMERARASKVTAGNAVPLAAARLLAPVPNPSKFLAIGMNYRKHVAEAAKVGVHTPPTQVWFNKQVSCINGPDGDVHLPRVSEQLDYEVELCVVIGQRCRHVQPQDAASVIAGYMVGNDVSVRDWQLRSQTMTIGKSFDTTGPTGPWIVTPDEVPTPAALRLRLWVNGELRQDDVAGNMIHDIAAQIAHLSAAFTLEPGDLLATGTPSGVGVAMDPPSFLKAGDVMRAQIDGIGTLENRVVAEPC
ncbi:fumarylacetoacetate hydrolase family protein [Variovorax dokdonensis]|uniref:Fumarylacetoacetate hydrolase family protein n=1 Tax=Variovorax dokdonensis TaxID=344883 RepID=A0ABT7N8Z3_9BURK|nr:fumarylacetoacetate hydrolase family protein [Variovorax dokdonensis]MDM0044415.1 fumarylacetoacetate hydrolase family protein [Variovorax dokdonensis]